VQRHRGSSADHRSLAPGQVIEGSTYEGFAG
jgi:hypothetical protein